MYLISNSSFGKFIMLFHSSQLYNKVFVKITFYDFHTYKMANCQPYRMSIVLEFQMRHDENTKRMRFMFVCITLLTELTTKPKH